MRDETRPIGHDNRVGYCSVTNPRARRLPRSSGFRFLDEVPGQVIAMAHRGGALHPANRGIENTLSAFRHAVGAGLRLPRD